MEPVIDEVRVEKLCDQVLTLRDKLSTQKLPLKAVRPASKNKNVRISTLLEELKAKHRPPESQAERLHKEKPDIYSLLAETIKLKRDRLNNFVEINQSKL